MIKSLYSKVGSLTSSWSGPKYLIYTGQFVVKLKTLVTATNKNGPYGYRPTEESPRIPQDQSISCTTYCGLSESAENLPKRLCIGILPIVGYE